MTITGSGAPLIGGYAGLSFKEAVYLARNPTQRTYATTWTRGMAVLTGPLALSGGFRSAIDELVDAFLSDWYRANQ